MSSLDIRFGILHNSYRRSESLNLDLADLFKPVLVDRTIFTLVNRKMIDPISDFYEVDEGVYLNDEGKTKFLREFEQKVSQRIKEGDDYTNYELLMRREIKKIERFFKQGETYKPYKYVN